jgi:hypothetical protein
MVAQSVAMAFLLVGRHAHIGQLIGAFITWMSRMAFDPLPVYLMARALRL